MADILKKYSIISLGSNCCIKKYLQHISATNETHLFDWIGTSLWSICEIFENNFDDFFSKQEYKLSPIIAGIDSIITHSRYYIRFMHDFDNGNMDLFDDFVEKYNRRITRLKDTLTKYSNSGQKILFLRLAENHKNRITYTQYQNKNIDETYGAKQLCKIISEIYPKLNFTLLLFDYNNKQPIVDDHLVVIRATGVITYGNCIPALEQIININKRFLEHVLI